MSASKRASKKAPAKRRPTKKTVKKVASKKAKKSARGSAKQGNRSKRPDAGVPTATPGLPELPQTGELLIVAEPIVEDEGPSKRALLDRRKSADRREYDRRAFPRPEGRRARTGRRTGDDT